MQPIVRWPLPSPWWRLTPRDLSQSSCFLGSKEYTVLNHDVEATLLAVTIKKTDVVLECDTEGTAKAM